MLVSVRVTKFKRFVDAEIELGDITLFVGPNNAGKTTALQALALWELGVRRLFEKHGLREPPTSRPGVTVNRRDLLALPMPSATMLFNDAHAFVDSKRQRITIDVAGVTQQTPWNYGIEIDYDNLESITIRPQRKAEGGWSMMPEAASQVRIAMLPPMSGLTSNETRIEPGAVAVRIGEGRTAEVLRNLCYRVHAEQSPLWQSLQTQIRELFGVELMPPLYRADRGEIEMSYKERGVELDLSSAGRGLQQTLLLLSYLQTHTGSVLLLDEPDAHLEILRQRQIYNVIAGVARRSGSQIVAATHSEVLLNEAADRDVVVAFVGRPHRIDDRGSQVVKALKEIGFDQYYQAEQQGWILYLEGATDLAILESFARTIQHDAVEHLQRPFVHYVGNGRPRARSHFYGLREAKSDLVGFAIYDRDVSVADANPLAPLRERVWGRREIENYLCMPEVLLEFAAQVDPQENGPLFTAGEISRRVQVMNEVISDTLAPIMLRDRAHPKWNDFKASDEFLDPLFEQYYLRLKLPNLMRKSDYHRLASLVEAKDVHPDIISVLDEIARIAKLAVPVARATLDTSERYDKQPMPTGGDD